MSVTWGQTRNPLSTNPNPWIRWDSVNYLSIAQHGLTFGSCYESTILEPTKPARSPLVRDCTVVAWLSRGSPIGSLDGHRIAQCWTSRFVVGDGGRDIPRVVWLGQGYPSGTSVRDPSPLCPLPRSCLQLRSLPNIVGPCRRCWCTLGCYQRKVFYSGPSYDRRRFVLSHRLDGSHWSRDRARCGRSTTRNGNRYPSGIMGSSRAIVVAFCCHFLNPADRTRTS